MEPRPFLTVQGGSPALSTAARVIGAAARHYAGELQADAGMMELASARFGLDKSTIDRLQIGYAPGNSLGQGIIREIDGRTGLLMDLGLYQEHGFGQPRSEAMAQRLTFPVLDRAGSIVGIHGRATRPGQGPSFVSLAEDAARKMPMMSGTGKQKAILVETALDHAALTQWGFDTCYTCVAMLGASPERVVAHLVGTGVKHATIAGEQSASGMARALELVLALKAQHINVAVVVDHDRRAMLEGRMSRISQPERDALLKYDQAPQGQQDEWLAAYELAIAARLHDMYCYKRASWMTVASTAGDLLALKDRGRLMLEAALVD